MNFKTETSLHSSWYVMKTWTRCVWRNDVKWLLSTWGRWSRKWRSLKIRFQLDAKNKNDPFRVSKGYTAAQW